MGSIPDARRRSASSEDWWGERVMRMRGWVIEIVWRPLGSISSSLFFVSEIGPGFSPDVKDTHEVGFSPWDMHSFGLAIKFG